MQLNGRLDSINGLMRRIEACDQDTALNELVGAIKHLTPVRGDVPEEWRSRLFTNLSVFVDEHPDRSNDDKLISAIIRFAADFNDQIGLAILDQCRSINIGSRHALWYAAYALKNEHVSNYATSLASFLHAIDVKADPDVFLLQQFSNFKSRMIKRMKASDDASEPILLGTYEDVDYTYSSGGVECRNKRGGICSPAFDFITEIGYIPPNPAPSPSTSRSATHSEMYKPAYSPDLLMDEDGHEMCFEEARLRALGFDVTASREPVPPQHSTESVKVMDLPKKSARPLQMRMKSPIPKAVPQDEERAQFNSTQGAIRFKMGADHDNSSGSSGCFMPDLMAQAPQSILRKRSDAPKIPEKRAGGVKFEEPANPSPRKLKRTLTPTTRRLVSIGEKLVINGNPYIVEQQLGNVTFMCSCGSHKLVLKPVPLHVEMFEPEHSEWFALMLPGVQTHYATEYQSCGTFNDFMEACHPDESSIVNEEVAWFCLLQLVRIVRTLENHFVIHGEINGDTLMNRIPEEELPKEFISVGGGAGGRFDLNGSYKDVGFILVRCDKIAANMNTDGPSPDRIAIANLFHKLCTRRDLVDAPEPAPRRDWNRDLWELAFRVLAGREKLDKLIEDLVTFLSKREHAIALRSRLSRYNTHLLMKRLHL